MSDDRSIEVIYETKPFQCQVCNLSLQPLTLQQRQAHYDSHFENSVPSKPTFSNNSNNMASKVINSTAANVKKAASPEPENVFWLPTQTTPPPHNFTPGIIPLLKHALLRAHRKGLTTKAVLCHSDATHIATEYWDMTWGCGYRNFLMACISLMSQGVQPMYFPLLDDPSQPPGIGNLQHWIEDAWANDFDREGADDLNHKLVQTRKWIGTAELYVAFTFKRIPAQLVDFPDTKRGPAAVIEWIINYFSPADETQQAINAFDLLKKANPVVITNKMPIILQHAGHSRTIIGYEIDKKGEPNLLVFDPARKLRKGLRQAALNIHSPSPNTHKGASSLIDRLFKNDRKRSIPDTNHDKRENKRVKGKKPIKLTADDKSVIVISDETEGDEDFMNDLDPAGVVNSFRLKQVVLAKKDKYQILYFPLEDPLTSEEMQSRRVVTSSVFL